MFYEIWGEQTNPGKVGSVDFSAEHEPCRCRPLIWARFFFVLVGLPILWGIAAYSLPLPAIQAWPLVIGLTVIYVALSYLIDPKPDLDNVGWLGGMMDNPVRYSDDLNRLLLGVKIVLGPGRFVAESLLDAFSEPASENETEFGRIDDEEAGRI